MMRRGVLFNGRRDSHGVGSMGGVMEGTAAVAAHGRFRCGLWGEGFPVGGDLWRGRSWTVPGALVVEWTVVVVGRTGWDSAPPAMGVRTSRTIREGDLDVSPARGQAPPAMAGDGLM